MRDIYEILLADNLLFLVLNVFRITKYIIINLNTLIFTEKATNKKNIIGATS